MARPGFHRSAEFCSHRSLTVAHIYRWLTYMCVLWWSEDDLSGSVLFFHPVGPRDQTQVTELGCRCPYPGAISPVPVLEHPYQSRTKVSHWLLPLFIPSPALGSHLYPFWSSTYLCMSSTWNHVRCNHVSFPPPNWVCFKVAFLRPVAWVK